MKRREFITLLGGASAMPLAARAQSLPVIGYFINGVAEGYTTQTSAFRRGLQETGYRENENVTIVYRWTGGQLKSNTGDDGEEDRSSASLRPRNQWRDSAVG